VINVNKLALAIIVAITFAVVISLNYLPASVKITKHPDYKFETIEGECIATDSENVYVMRVDPKVPPVVHIWKVNGWNLTLNESLWIPNVQVL